jgi:hypothetical protein
MIKSILYIVLCNIAFLQFYNPLAAQETPKEADTFFLAKKKGLLGRFGKSISRTPPDEAPVKVVNPFLKYRGKIIRSIETIRLDFSYNFEDTNKVRHDFGTRVAKKFHKVTTDKTIQRNLFFKEGDPLYPYLFADNERYLRDLVYIKDARILVVYAEGGTDSVDVLILTKDIFSIGVKLGLSSINKGRAELREENFLGSGTRLQLSSYYEKDRFQKNGIGGELIVRNMGGTFIDWVSGYQDYKTAFTSDRSQETVIYTRIEKPLATPFISSTGALEWSYQQTRNFYISDSLYLTDVKYGNYNLDAWFGYRINKKGARYLNKELSVNNYIAVRGFKQHFLILPLKYKSVYDYRFADFTGALASMNIFKQVFYKTSFLYGFGVSEDVPEGYSMVFTGGYLVKQNIKRPYSGADITLSRFNKQGFYSDYTFRAGGYFYRDHFEDVDLLFSADHFTRLKKLSSNWYSRIFINTSITARVNPVLNAPLFLRSDFGLPYFNNDTLRSDLRTTVKGEWVFYNTTKLLGFRFAPFAFTDLCLLKPYKMDMKYSNLYTAVGGGARTRNENLVFGTIELKAYYFPRINGDMNRWKVELNSNIRFKYRSRYIHRPDFIIVN